MDAFDFAGDLDLGFGLIFFQMILIEYLLT